MLIDNVQLDIIIKLAIAALLGGLVGLEREFNKSAAGIKTYAIICLGSALFTHASNLTDIKAAAGVITGIGFLGAAVVFKNEGGVVGITTASLVWAIAAVGFTVGLGMYFTAIVATLLLLIILIPVEYIEKKILKTHAEKGF